MALLVVPECPECKDAKKVMLSRMWECSVHGSLIYVDLIQKLKKMRCPTYSNCEEAGTAGAFRPCAECGVIDKIIKKIEGMNKNAKA